jgi:hypothetical protein
VIGYRHDPPGKGRLPIGVTVERLILRELRIPVKGLIGMQGEHWIREPGNEFEAALLTGCRLPPKGERRNLESAFVVCSI